MTTFLFWFGIVLLMTCAVTAFAVFAWSMYELFKDYRKSSVPAQAKPVIKNQYTPSPTFRLRSPKN